MSFAPNPLTRRARLDRLYDRYREEEALAHLRDLPGRMFVPGRGSLHPRVVLVGEAPGKQENEMGMPFVGRAGVMLDALMRNAGLEPERDAFITNVIKWRPKNNRTPRPDELQAARPYLLRELNILQPRVVGLLGKVASSLVFGPDVRMNSMHGQFRAMRHNVHDSWRMYFVLYHPAAMIYNKNMEDMLHTDFRRMADVIFSNNIEGML